MKRLFFIVAVMLTLLAAATSNSQTTTCTATGFVRDSINLTAALINPQGTVSGDVDATGCHIAIYYGPGAKGRVSGANIHGAHYFGVVSKGGNVDITDSTIYEIGDSPLSGSQHGNAIYFAFGSKAKGSIKGNVIWNYQKGGIVVNGTGANVDISQIPTRGVVSRRAVGSLWSEAIAMEDRSRWVPMSRRILRSVMMSASGSQT